MTELLGEWKVELPNDLGPSNINTWGVIMTLPQKNVSTKQTRR